MRNIVTDLTATKANLLAVFSVIDPQDLNSLPFEGSWTAAQVGEHLLKATGVGVFYAETEASQRQMDEKVQALSDIFLNFDLKLTPPASIVPSDQPHEKDVLIKQLDEVYTSAIEAAKTLDLSAICLSYVIPAFGPMTRLEFLWLFNVHTIRHIHQLKNITVALVKV